MKVKPKSIGASLEVAISLGTSVTLIWLSVVASRQTMKRSTCV
jgi:hypothetical protein